MGRAENLIARTMERMMPVGTIIEWCPVDGGGVDLSTPAKVFAYYGFGTWEAYGQGRMLLGVSDSHAVGSTGGEESVALRSENNGPHRHAVMIAMSGAQSRSTESIAQSAYIWNSSGEPVSPAATIVSSDGSGLPHENMPPYITIYRWRRIA